MFSLIAVFIPSVLGVKLIDCILKKSDWKRMGYFYCLLLLVSTIINNIIAVSIFGLSSDLLLSLNTDQMVFIKYTIVSIIVNILIAIIIVINVKHLSIDIVVKKNEKSKK